MFTNKDLKNLIIPLFLEQLLVMLVGIADTFVISYAGEAAVSGVSLVNSFNTIFIYLFTALASRNCWIRWQELLKPRNKGMAKSMLQVSVPKNLVRLLFLKNVAPPGPFGVGFSRLFGVDKPSECLEIGGYYGEIA